MNKVKIKPTNQPKETTEISPFNNSFKTWYVQLPLNEAFEKRDAIKEACGWSRAVWFNKLHGLTTLKLLEMNEIAKIAGQEPETMFNF